MNKSVIISIMSSLIVSTDLSAEESLIKAQITDVLPVINSKDFDALQKLLNENYEKFSPETIELIKALGNKNTQVTVTKAVSAPNVEELIKGVKRSSTVEIIGTIAGPKDQAGH